MRSLRGDAPRRGTAAVLLSLLALVTGPCSDDQSVERSPASFTPERAAARGLPFLGVNSTRELEAADLRRLGSTDLRSFRFDLNWRFVERLPGVFDWARYDELVRNASSARVELFPLLVGTPRWVSPAVQHPPEMGDETGRYAAFIGIAVRRYGPGGSFWRSSGCRMRRKGAFGSCPRPLQYRPLTTWEVWNEPNSDGFWGGDADAKEYAALLRAASGAIRVADPTARVVFGGLALFRVERRAFSFVERAMAAGRTRCSFDDVAIHPYGPTVRRAIEEVRRARARLDELGLRDAGLWATEWGWSTSGPPDRLLTTLAGQRRRVRRFAAVMSRGRDDLKLRGLHYFNYADQPPSLGGYGDWYYYTGLLDDGLRPKPAWAALASAPNPMRPTHLGRPGGRPGCARRA